MARRTARRGRARRASGVPSGPATCGAHGPEESAYVGRVQRLPRGGAEHQILQLGCRLRVQCLQRGHRKLRKGQRAPGSLGLGISPGRHRPEQPRRWPALEGRWRDRRSRRVPTTAPGSPRSAPTPARLPPPAPRRIRAGGSRRRSANPVTTAGSQSTALRFSRASFQQHEGDQACGVALVHVVSAPRAGVHDRSEAHVVAVDARPQPFALLS